ncbi:hypothetical protein BC936DRAFT_138985 [Jimgerdemannia flammicorona]|uniref:Uncharacterized protein n=2 Tax=Jimgerdemannia flammicorona TaxID=994334 RepID=A0A433Q6N2_9FUNG|nr:hypothetical protein BC936DRAFT_138985 [Jimgerdemannia flammicorona]RUS25411.1 hypothetical protein BC938DRAFT_472218 [Jimgerdemannia flammicorona]
MKLKALKVRPRKPFQTSPCLAEMGLLLECWSKVNVDDPRCAMTARALADCMAKPVRFAQ